MPTEKQDILARFLTLHPKLIDFSLERVYRLLKTLDNPHEKLPPVIHIAGTNGKGSVLAFLTSLLEQHGLRVHAYSSPHLVDFNERIYLNGEYIADDMLCDYLTRVEQANDNQPITFFEITSCAAFLAFAEQPADIVILETGLGGRLDATNVVDNPFVTIITPISLDHQHYLGDSLEKIAFEKAGIIKKNAPVMLAKQDSEVRDIIKQQALKVGAGTVYLQGQHFFDQQEIGKTDWSFVYQGRSKHHLPPPALAGAHQYQNACLALATLHYLEQRQLLNVKTQWVSKALENVTWRARLQRIDDLWHHNFLHPHQPQEIWLDGSHNVAGATILDDFLRTENQTKTMPTYVIIAMLEHKDVTEFIKILKRQTTYGVAMSIPEQEMSMSALSLSLLAQKNQWALSPKDTLIEAYHHIADISGQTDYRLLITGSLYFAGHILEHLHKDV